MQALFFGLGSDGTVGANKSSVKIIGEGTDLFAQGYFVYDSKKSGSVTVSHLRFGPDPIRSTYLIDGADFVACHQFGLLDKMKVLEHARPGATFLLNSPFGPDEVWDHLPVEVQEQIVAKDIALWVVDAEAIARAAGMGNRINTVMQPCFFSLSGVLPADEAVERIKASVAKAYAKRGQTRRRPQLRRHRRVARRAGPGHGARGGERHPPPSAARAGRAPPTSCSGSPRGCWRATATCSRCRRCPPTAPSRRAPPGTRSGPSPPRSRSGTRTSASTAPSAPSSAPTPPSA